MRDRIGVALVASSLALNGCTLVTSGWEQFRHAGADAAIDASERDGGAGDGGPNTCDPACAESGSCLDGVCRCGGGDACDPGASCCDDECVDTAANVEHCGGCEMPCPFGDRATRTCAEGECGFSCQRGFLDCDDASPGCETDLGAHDTCGSCENECGSGELCAGDADTGFSCQTRCDAPFRICGGSCVNVTTSLSHCGDCDAPCASAPNAIPSCSLGACSYTCVGEFVDCNGSIADGCERIPALYYPDNDGDGWGSVSAGSSRFCPDEVPFAWAPRTGDCDDSQPASFPGNREVCDGVDNDCNSSIDEGLAGLPCGCTTGGTSGVTVCGGGCIFPVESCNSVDDDCDTFVDEDVATMPSTTIGTFSTTGGSIFPYVGTATWVPSRAMGAIAFASQRDATSYDIRFSRFDATAATFVSDVLVTTRSTEPMNLSVAWDGSAWAILWVDSSSSRMRYLRVRDDGSLATMVADFPNTSGRGSDSSFAIAQGEDQFAVVYALSGPSEIWGTVFADGAVLDRSLRFYSSIFALSVNRGAVAYIGDGDYAVLYRNPSDNSVVYQRYDSDALIGASRTHVLDGVAKYPWDAAYDPTTDRVVFTWYVPSDSRAYQMMVEAESGMASFGALDIGPAQTPLVVRADDGSFFSTTNSSATPLRTRAVDGALYPSSVFAFDNVPMETLGLEGSSNRYMVFHAAGGSGSILAQVVTCR
jgi:hypothetical protein